MKKIIFFICLIILAVTTTGCDGKNNAADSISDYFPAKTNAYYEYDDNGAGKLKQEIYNMHISGNRIQRLITTDLFPYTEVLEMSNGELRLVYGAPHYLFFDNITTVNEVMDALILKEPLKVGNTWDFDAKAKCEITSLKKRVNTPAGDYDAMEVTITSPDLVQKEYYAKGVGLVKSVYTYSDIEYVMELNKITEGTAYIVDYEFYYPGETGEAGIENRSIMLYTNCDLAQIFEEEYKKPPVSMSDAVLADGIKFNNISIDWSSASLTLDMSHELDNAVMDAIKLSLIGFFDVEEVSITVGIYE